MNVLVCKKTLNETCLHTSEIKVNINYTYTRLCMLPVVQNTVLCAVSYNILSQKPILLTMLSPFSSPANPSPTVTTPKVVSCGAE